MGSPPAAYTYSGITKASYTQETICCERPQKDMREWKKLSLTSGLETEGTANESAEYRLLTYDQVINIL